MSSHHDDVLIIGAGAAGLACAYELDQTPLRYRVLEARDRLGGRVFTHHPEAHLPAQELGAEFIHGSARQTLDWMQRLQLPFCDVSDQHLFREKHKLAKIPKFFEHLDQMMPGKSILKQSDVSVKAYLEKLKAPARWKKIFASFVEGFHAADLEKIGIQGLMSAQQADESDLNGSQMFRNLMGYDQLFQGIHRSLRNRDALLLNMQVRKIEWSRGRVKVIAKSLMTQKTEAFTAQKIVITVPIGVLQNEASPDSKIYWDPMPRNLSSALQGLEMGSAQRMNFVFRDRFWENLWQDEPISFLHAGPENHFPTWWTLAPLRVPQLVAWQGGPYAQAMSQWTLEQKIEAAFKTLSRLTNRSISFLEKNCVSCSTHDWGQDPFSLGAYSYIKSEGIELARKILLPVDDTVYFAGEATCFDSSRGTVDGALASGARVGQAVIRSRLKGKIDSRVQKRKSHSAASADSAASH